MRIIYDNATDRATSLTASSTAGTLVASNMQVDTKSLVWRSTSTTANLQLVWNSAEIIGGVILPFTNLTSTATIRVRGYSDNAFTTLLFDTGTVLAAPYIPLTMWEWGVMPLGVNSYSYGGGAYGRVWVPYGTISGVLSLQIDLVDTANTSGYIEVSRLVMGTYWEPSFNPGYGQLPVSYKDSSTTARNQAGDLITTIGTRSKTVSATLGNLLAEDRTRFVQIVRGNGLPKPLFISMFPNDTDPDKEQTYQVYGKLSALNPLNYANFIMYASQLDIEEI